ncbi:hypothetical protein FA15DRAFT_335169 [Coprinopsis marcescibilis]|uniref:Secreted protein n=1 Tax=Coprinopsis marcescibilis TaxID=230819 RepID=A0A5C3KYP9_COPMA|nr:hypothetical protein FA15DRAFT_335169 [Coprinopsis marcescibilis]
MRCPELQIIPIFLAVLFDWFVGDAAAGVPGRANNPARNISSVKRSVGILQWFPQSHDGLEILASEMQLKTVISMSYASHHVSQKIWKALHLFLHSIRFDASR